MIRAADDSERPFGDGRMSAILGVSINGDDVRMAIADAPMAGDPSSYGGRGMRMRSVEEFDASALLQDVPPYGTPEEQVAYALRPLFAGAERSGVRGPVVRRTGRQIRSVVFAYHDSDQAKRITMGTDVAGLSHYSLVPTPVAALAELMVTRQVGFARTVAVCNVDTWRYSCGFVEADGELIGDIQRISTDKLAAAGADVLEGLAMVVDAAQQTTGRNPDVVVLVGENVEQQFDPEVVELELGLPVIIPASPEMLVARGASLLPSRSAAGTYGMGAASDGDWAPVAARPKRGPDWMSSAAALGGMVGLLVLGGVVVAGVTASGVFSSGNEASGTSTTATPSPVAQEPPPPAPPPPEPEPTTTEAPAPNPRPAPNPAPAPEPAPEPAPAPEPEPAPAPEPPPPPQQPAPPQPQPQPQPPPAPPEIEIPGLPPIQLPPLP